MKNYFIFIQNFKLVIKNILGNKKRSFLTCLGIIIGLAAVMSMSAIFECDGMLTKIINTKYGFNNLCIYYVSKDARPKGLTQSDIDKLSSIEGVYQYSPFIKYEKLQIEYNRKKIKNVRIIGRSEYYFMYDPTSRIIAGRGLTKEDNDNRSRVCIIDEKTRKNFFKTAEEAIGKKIRIAGSDYTVVGVDNVDSDSIDRYMADGTMFVTLPIMTIQTTYGCCPDSFTLYSDANEEEVMIIHDEIVSIMEEITHGTSEDGSFFDAFYGDYFLQAKEDAIKQATEQSLIAGICLLVGGIGIMNMMFISVTERTREIGLRKALGATPAAIQRQFVMESIVLSMFGGLIGSIIGIIASLLVNAVNFLAALEYLKGIEDKFVIQIDFKSMLIGWFFCVVIGVVFGYLPARKASRMNPIDALKL